REQAQAEAYQTVSAELQQNARQDDRASRRSLHVRVGQPGVQRPDRNLDGEGGEEAQEQQRLDGGTAINVTRRSRSRLYLQDDLVDVERAEVVAHPQD